MAKKKEKYPGFVFYPGDYLRDTQCLGERAQVAYDRIMCEHMRNIVITNDRLKFFTKKLIPDEVEELKSVLAVVNGGFQIEWVVLSIIKTKAYSDSRRKNREGKNKKTTPPTPITYVPHMDIDTDTGIDTEKKLELGGAGGRGKVFSIITKETVEGWRQSVLADGPFVDLLCMKGKISLNQFPEVEQEFFKRKLLTGEWKEWESESKMRGNFLNWMPIYGEKQRTKKSNGTYKPTGERKSLTGL